MHFYCSLQISPCLNNILPRTQYLAKVGLKFLGVHFSDLLDLIIITMTVYLGKLNASNPWNLKQAAKQA